MADRYTDIPMPEDMEDEMLSEPTDEELGLEEEMEGPLAEFDTEELMAELERRGELPPREDVIEEDIEEDLEI